MAIYHFSAKVISRASGSSALASAAYRSASRQHDERLDRNHDFSNKAGVVHSEVMLPDDAPEHLADREKLWNAVEAAEVRKDAQLAREIEFAIPRELDQTEGIRLARDFVRAEFVDRGMIADLNVHWDVGADGEPKPHAHVMLTTRSVGDDGFGAKVRDWNRTDLLQHWRETWAEHVNHRLAELDIEARVDHRSLEAQGIDLEPQHKIGPAASRMAAQRLALERVDEHREIARSNGEKLLASPALALDAITHGQATFTTRDLAMFVHRHSEGKEQFDRIMAAVKAAPELVRLGLDGRGQERFTSRAMLDTEQRLERVTHALHASRRHGVPDRHRDAALARGAARGMILSPEQRSAIEHVTKGQVISTVIGYAGTGKSAMLGVAREAWEGAGYHVRGAALSGIAAENLEHGSGIASRTIASLEHQWGQGREMLGPSDMLVIDEAGMIGTRQMERVITEAHKCGAKVVLVGDPEQLQAIEAGAAFRSIAEAHGSVEITDIRRQREDWQRDATRHLATGRTDEALQSYEQAGHVHAADTREAARAGLVDRWDRERSAAPEATRIILTHTRDEVRALNELARERLRQAGQLGAEMTIKTERGKRSFAPGDRLMFLKNERSLGVKNGSLGTVESVGAARMAVISYAAGGMKRAAFREVIQAGLKNELFYTNEVRLDIVLHLDVQTVLETDETADVDNYAKAILDGLKGPNGILFDDTQVQALTIYWLDSYGRDRTYFEVSISSSPDDFMLKPVEFYEMPDGLWYPHGRRMWSDGGQEDQSDRNHYAGLLILEVMSSVKRDARHLFRKSGMDRLRAYQQGMYVSSSARGFHRGRIDEGFPMHARREWWAAFEGWRGDHSEEIAEIEQIVEDVRENYRNMAALLAGQTPLAERDERKIDP